VRRTKRQDNVNGGLPARHDRERKASPPLFDNKNGVLGPTPSVVKLQQLINALHTELESLSGGHSLKINETIDFYSAVISFEIGLIKRALQRTEGHQGRAARLLNLNPSTLNAKIKQYDIKFF